MLLLLTLNTYHTFSSVSIADFAQINVCWAANQNPVTLRPMSIYILRPGGINDSLMRFHFYFLLFNPFVPNAPFFYLLKTSETLGFSDVFRG